LPVADPSTGTRHVSFDQLSGDIVGLVVEHAAVSDGQSLLDEEFALGHR